MKKAINFDSIVSGILKGVIKWFAWLILILSVIVLVLVTLVNNFSVDFSSKSFTLFALLSSICSFAVYMSFSLDGQINGKDTEPYAVNFRLYKKATTGLMRDDINEYIKVAHAGEIREYILEVCSMTGLTESQIRGIDIKGKQFRKEFSLQQRLHIARVQAHKYPNTMPKNAASVLNVLTKKPKGSHGVDTEAKRRFLRRKRTLKLISITLLMVLTAAIAIEAVSGNWLQTIIKIVFVLIALVFSLFTGYNDGFTATAEIEKDILGAILRFISDMDIWLKAQGRERQVAEAITDDPIAENDDPG